MILSFKGKKPSVADARFVADNSSIIGDVSIGAGSSVWFGAVLRGDFGKISIGENSNIQDNAVLHCAEGYAVEIGNLVSVGHNAVVHGARLGDNVIVGMGAVVMNGAEIGADTIIGAGAVITENTVVPSGSVVVGIPGKIVKNAPEQNHLLTEANALAYSELAIEYAEKDKRA